MWILLIKRDMTRASYGKRQELVKGNGEDVNTDVLQKICTALNCTLDNIVEITRDKPNDLEGEDR